MNGNHAGLGLEIFKIEEPPGDGANNEIKPSTHADLTRMPPRPEKRGGTRFTACRPNPLKGRKTQLAFRRFRFPHSPAPTPWVQSPLDCRPVRQGAQPKTGYAGTSPADCKAALSNRSLQNLFGARAAVVAFAVACPLDDETAARALLPKGLRRKFVRVLHHCRQLTSTGGSTTAREGRDRGIGGREIRFSMLLRPE